MTAEYRKLANLLLDVANTHGRTKVVKILRKYGAARLFELKLGDVEGFTEDMLALQETNPCGQQTPTTAEWEKHAEQYPNAHRRMLWRIERIRSGVDDAHQLLQ
jgi:hypothetical protein